VTDDRMPRSARYLDGAKAGQLPSRLRLIRGDLENVAVLLRGGCPVPGPGGGAGQAGPGLDVAGLLARHAPPLVHRLVVLLGLPEAPGEPEAKRAPGAIEGHRAPILLAMSWWVCFAKMGRKFEKQHTFPLLVLRRDYKAQELPG